MFEEEFDARRVRCAPHWIFSPMKLLLKDDV